MNRISSNCWPTPTQELLLRAALGTGEDAKSSWAAWQERTDIEHLDGGSTRLLPLLWFNLKTQGLGGAQSARDKSVARHHWVQNQLLLKRVARFIEQLEGENIPTLVLNGSALVSLYYPDISARPMDDFDVLVPTLDARRAFDFLRAQGYQLDRRINEWNHSARSVHGPLAVFHSVSFKTSDDDQCDLHHHVFPEEFAQGADEEFWRNSVTLCIGGAATRALCAEDAFLHVCAHGAVWNEVPPLRWIADAVLILRATPGFNWNHLTTRAQRHGLTLALCPALRYLRHLDVQPIPPSVIRALAQVPTSRAARREWRALSRSPQSRSLALRFWLRARAFGRWNAANPITHRPFTFLRYLQLFWGLDSSSQVLSHGLKRLSLLQNMKQPTFPSKDDQLPEQGTSSREKRGLAWTTELQDEDKQT